MEGNSGYRLTLLEELQRHDEEAVIDQGITSNADSIRYESELEDHRSLYRDLRMPLARQCYQQQEAHRAKRGRRDREKGYHYTRSQREHLTLEIEEDQRHVRHEVFSELDEICVKEGESAEWKETARWLKFEEDVEDGAGSWSKPYVGTLSLDSIFELRRCIINGTVLLDVCANSIKEIADTILDHQEQRAEFDESMRARVQEVLLRSHQHLQKKRSHRPASSFLFAGFAAAQSGVKQETTTVDLSKAERRFLRKIPSGAEAFNVLVGELDFLRQPIVAFVRLSSAVVLSGVTEVPIPTRFLFVLLGPEGKGHQYHEIGRSMATLLMDEVFREVAYKARKPADLVAGMDRFLEQVTVLPPGEWDPSIRIEPPENVPAQGSRQVPGALNDSAAQSQPEKHSGPELEWTGRLFGGFIQDVKRKASWYWSDFRDGFNLKCLASILFLYCACMSPVVTFGGLLGDATEDRISVVESLLGACLSGVVYYLFAGQPLTIITSTGPILIFEKILYEICKNYRLSYLSMRVCVGLWTSFFSIVLVATDASCLVRYVTRFTEETYTALTCLMFIYEALEKLVQLREVYPVHMHSSLDFLTTYSCKCAAPAQPSNETLRFWESNRIDVTRIAWENLTVTECRRLHGEFQGSACGPNGPYTPNVFFWCCILLFCTFGLANLLKSLKTSRYFTTRVRSTLSDFAVFLTLVIMALVDFLMGIPSPKLHVPHVLKPTRDDRGWLIHPIGPNPWWSALAASIPALLSTILIFMDQQITLVIVNRKEHKLKKGCGYHLDYFIMAVMLGVCSVMGLPWFVAATVLSITHVNSLKVESACSAPGEKAQFTGVQEQRVTGIMIFVLLGCSVFFTSLLKFVPMPVLYGVFLYMGVSSLSGLQLLDRVRLFWTPAKHQPDIIYLRHVPLRKVHLFTAIQLTCLATLWVVRMTPAAIIFPLLDMALVLVRKAMDFCFSQRELVFLDGLMPGSKKKQLDEAKAEGKEGEESMEAAGAANLV